jgi:hypothetical protein
MKGFCQVTKRISRRGPARKGGDWEACTNAYGVLTTIGVDTALYLPLVGIVPVAAASGIAAFPVGRYAISEVDITVDWLANSSAPAVFQTSVGLYVSTYDSNNLAFSKQRPNVPADGSRDNWLHLWHRTWLAPISSSVTTETSIPHSVRVKRSIMVAQGQTLMLVFDNGINSSTSVALGIFARVRVAKIN